MSRSRKSRSLILAAAPWVVLLVMGVSATRLGPSRAQNAMLGAWVVLMIACLVGPSLGRVSFRTACPGCGRRALRRLVRDPRFHQCPACGGRWESLGGGVWVAAFGPGRDAVFRPRTEAGVWLDAPFAATDESTCGALLRKKRELAGSLDDLLRESRKSGPDILDPVPKGSIKPVPGETTGGALLRGKRSREQPRGGGPVQEDRPSAPPLWDRWLDP